MTTQSLTLTEAAERLAPVFVEETGSSAAMQARPRGKWLSLQHAGAVLAERVTGQKQSQKKGRAEVTIQQAGKQIEQPQTPAELSEIRQRRMAASVNQWQRQAELENFSQSAIQHFQGWDEETALNSYDFQVLHGHIQHLRAVNEEARFDEQGAWHLQCKAENDAFMSGRPNWSHPDAMKVAGMLTSLGISTQEMQQLWLTPHPIDVTSPLCVVLARLVVGAEHPEPIHAALKEVGFDDDEIAGVMLGEIPVVLRDHRIQELVARAVDADTAGKDRAAA